MFGYHGSARVNTVEICYDISPIKPDLRSNGSLRRLFLLHLFAFDQQWGREGSVAPTPLDNATGADLTVTRENREGGWGWMGLGARPDFADGLIP